MSRLWAIHNVTSLASYLCLSILNHLVCLPGLSNVYWLRIYQLIYTEVIIYVPVYPSN